MQTVEQIDLCCGAQVHRHALQQRDLRENPQERVLSPLSVSIQDIRLRGTRREREEMLLSHITDRKPGEKSRATQNLLQYRQCYTLDADSHADCSSSPEFSWSFVCPCRVTLDVTHYNNLHKAGLVAFAFAAEQTTLKTVTRNRVRSASKLAEMKW